MNQIHLALIKAWQIGDKDVQDLLGPAIKRAELLFPQLSNIVARATHLVKVCQPFEWLGGLDEGRWLTREVELYVKESNDSVMPGNTPKAGYTR
jgi:hypothetical protein